MLNRTASSVTRSCCQRSACRLTSARLFSDERHPVEVKTPGFAAGELATNETQSVGKQYEEFQSYLEGHRRFNRGSLFGPFGTQTEPTEVLSAFDSRIVGCTGGGDSGEHPVNWLNVKSDRKTVCVLCGQFFKVVHEAKHMETEVDDDE
jgi:uncharacterized Zn-finger protein